MKPNPTHQIAENKLLILYLIDKLNFEITNSQIAKIVINIREINYFYLQQYISELIKDKYVECKIIGENRFYTITPEGKQVLDYFKTIILASVRKKIDDVILAQSSDLRTETQVTSEYIPQNENEYMVSCRIFENSTCLIDLNFYAGSKENAKDICQNWNKNAQKIYSNIVGLLTNSKQS
jgi:predicted transcriptional regulator